MATKKQQLDAKLGSWTDQASLTRTQPEEIIAGVAPQPEESAPVRAAYTVDRGLLDRIDEAAQKGALNRSQVVGHLLTWALDQMDAGHVQLP